MIATSMISFVSKLRVATFACCLAGCLAVAAPAAAERMPEDYHGRRTPGEVTHLFRYAPVDGRPGAIKSGWRVKWTVIEPLSPDGKRLDHEYGEAAILELTSVEFMRGTAAGTEGAWLKVLSNLALSELYTFYNELPKSHEGPAVGPPQQEVLDVQQDPYDFVHFEDRDEVVRLGFISSNPASNAEVLSEDGVVVKEIRDDGIRAVWARDGPPKSLDAPEPIRAIRGEVMTLWALLKAGNYYYVIEYGFVDDGTVRARFGASGNNYYLHHVGSNSAVHQHFGCWRMSFAAEPSAAASVLQNVVQRDRARARVVRRPFNNGREGGETWDAETFGSLEMALSADAQAPAAYVLVPRRAGSGRAKHPMTAKDFWITVQEPQNAGRRKMNEVRNAYRSEKDTSERRCSDVPSAVARTPESLRNRPLVIWHQSAFLHIPRKEDFGATAADPHAALTAWTGFDLVPRNIWDTTPFIRPPLQ